MSITSKELAKILNLSPAAVSMALNNKPGVSTATRKLVIETADRYGYDFSRLEKKHNIKGTIYFIIYRKHGAVVGDTPFFSALSDGIAQGCKKADYKMRISYIYEDERNVAEQLEEIQYSDCVGMIVLGTEMQPEDLKPFLALPLPFVLLDTYFETISCNYILINNVQGAYLAASHLISRTKKQPGYLHSAYPIGNFAERNSGFFKAVRAHGMASSKSIVHLLTPSMDGAYADMKEILENIENKEELAPCYFADNDLIAMGAMKAFKEAGFRIPQDIAIVGFDNLPFSKVIEPSLTTIHVPKQYMGEMAAARLIELLCNPSASPIKIEIGTTLIERRSSQQTLSVALQGSALL